MVTVKVPWVKNLGGITSGMVVSRELNMLEKIQVDKMTEELSVSR